MMQSLIVALIVSGCTAYAVWVLMPQALRRRLALRLQHWPLPRVLAGRVQRAATGPTGCGGCGGCDDKPKPRPSAVQPIRIHRAPKP
jgi:hypothetical protein